MSDKAANSQTTRETEQQRLGAFFALGGFPSVPPHDEPAACREAWLRGYDEAKTTPATPCACCGEPATRRSTDGVPLCEGDYQHLLEHDAEAVEHG
jgi:hypothetical protein